MAKPNRCIIALIALLTLVCLTAGCKRTKENRQIQNTETGAAETTAETGEAAQTEDAGSTDGAPPTESGTETERETETTETGEGTEGEETTRKEYQIATEAPGSETDASETEPTEDGEMSEGLRLALEYAGPRSQTGKSLLCYINGDVAVNIESVVNQSGGGGIRTSYAYYETEERYQEAKAEISNVEACIDEYRLIRLGQEEDEGVGELSDSFLVLVGYILY